MIMNSDVLVRLSLPPIEEIFATKGRVKILVILAIYGELSSTEIRHLSLLNSSSVRIHLDYLLRCDIIKERKPDKELTREEGQWGIRDMILKDLELRDPKKIRKLYSLNKKNQFVVAFLTFLETIYNFEQHKK